MHIKKATMLLGETLYGSAIAAVIPHGPKQHVVEEGGSV